MKAFTKVKVLWPWMNRANIDTDMIIPGQFLKSIKRSGFGLICLMNCAIWMWANLMPTIQAAR